ncbi:DUF2508 family protein [Desulfotruncus alcoholivorax]|uniref:DUF2508 family protein n=1 Tax=Desulfotruncus alcoholivorax TaxID=265477 RepID=UPI0003FF6EF3|nr:DUF2508 family protein [Desulfotruncus alcoholivorax]
MNTRYLENFLIWLSPLAKQPPKLLDAVNEAKRTWKQALMDFNHITDRDLIDFAILNIKASERRYMALVRKAKEEGVCAWPEHVCAAGPAQNEAGNRRAPAG